LLTRQRKELKAAEEAAADAGSDSAAAQRLKELALVESVSRRWITGAEGLEDKDETTSCTPLLSHAFLGDVEATERLLQARADHEAVSSQGRTALLSAAEEGNAEITLLLLKYKANLEATGPVSVCEPLCSFKPYLSFVSDVCLALTNLI
jgi:ankyrin repeat protein